MTVVVSSDRAAIVDAAYFWRPIASCPIGHKVQLINRHLGCAAYGLYKSGDTYWTHWAPLPTFGDNTFSRCTHDENGTNQKTT